MTSKVTIPTTGEKITIYQGRLNVPNQPIIPYIEGDGIGVDVTPTMIKVVDAAVQRAYGGDKKIEWMEVYAGEKATAMYDSETWLPEGNVKFIQRIQSRYQRASNDTCWWRYPFFKCCTKTSVRFIRLSKACAIVHRRAFTCEAS